MFLAHLWRVAPVLRLGSGPDAQTARHRRPHGLLATMAQAMRAGPRGLSVSLGE